MKRSNKRGWTEAIVKDLEASGKIRGFQVIGPKQQLATPAPTAAADPGRTKYGSKAITVDGIPFQSIKEATRYKDLKLMVKAGEVGQLEMQRSFLLVPAKWEVYHVPGKRPGRTRKRKRCVERSVRYKADFVYRMMSTGDLVVEDVKSEATRKLSTYILKRKLMLEVHGIRIEEK